MSIDNFFNWIAVWSAYLEFQCELLLPATCSRGSDILIMSLKYSETHSDHGGACEARRGPQHEISGFPEAAHEAKCRNDGFCTAVGCLS